jgi:hypothetical protein
MSDIIEHIRALSEETDNILVWNDDDLEAQKDAEIIQEENLVKVKADKWWTYWKATSAPKWWAKRRVSQLEQFPETTEIDITSEEKKWKQNKLIMIEIIIKLI